MCISNHAYSSFGEVLKVYHSSKHKLSCPLAFLVPKFPNSCFFLIPSHLKQVLCPHLQEWWQVGFNRTANVSFRINCSSRQSQSGSGGGCGKTYFDKISMVFENVSPVLSQCLPLSFWAFPAQPSLWSLLWSAPWVSSVPCGRWSFQGTPSWPRIAGGPGLFGSVPAVEFLTLCSQYALRCYFPGNQLCHLSANPW